MYFFPMEEFRWLQQGLLIFWNIFEGIQPELLKLSNQHSLYGESISRAHSANYCSFIQVEAK